MGGQDKEWQNFRISWHRTRKKREEIHYDWWRVWTEKRHKDSEVVEKQRECTGLWANIAWQKGCHKLVQSHQDGT